MRASTHKSQFPGRGRKLALKALALVAGVVLAGCSSASWAADASRFDPGYIISDQEFFDYQSMNAAQIQSFLEKKFAERYGTSQCTPGADQNGETIPCLKDFVFPDSFKDPVDPLPMCQGLPAMAGKKASDLIKLVSDSCKINPKVLLVLLQKEQSLITANGSRLTTRRYAHATGFACPDSRPCDDSRSGLLNQLYYAGSRFHQYLQQPYKSGFHYHPFENIRVRFSPRSGCNGSVITLKTNATAGLYNYTPYQPNPEVLKHLGDPQGVPGNGPGAICGAYGNINFWRLYTNWFNDPAPGSNNDPRKSFVRLGGKTRIETAIGISRRQFPNGAKAVYLARKDLLVDALAAGAVKDGPILLVDGNRPPVQAVLDEINRLNPQMVYAIGATGAVNDDVLTMSAQGRKVGRLGGKDRYGSAEAVAKFVYQGKRADTVYLVDGLGPNGQGSPDALSAGMLDDGPVVLVNDGHLGEAKSVVAALNPREIVALGGPAVVSDATLAQIASGRASSRLAGTDRYTTAIEIAKAAFPSGARSVVLASGNVFADAVAAGTLTKNAILLTPPDPARMGPILAAFAALKPQIMAVAGGPGAFPDAVGQAAAAAAAPWAASAQPLPADAWPSPAPGDSGQTGTAPQADDSGASTQNTDGSRDSQRRGSEPLSRRSPLKTGQNTSRVPQLIESAETTSADVEQ